MLNNVMHYMHIYECAISDGTGVRVSLYVSGCRNHCPGCHNKESWDFSAGSIFTFQAFERLMKALRHPYVRGLTICGGEPMEPENQHILAELVKQIKKELPEKDIWCYTGYQYEDLLEGGKQHFESTDYLLANIDVLIDGPFILEKRDITDNNRWRGSTNQRVIDMNKTRAAGKPIPLADTPNNNF